MGRVIPTHVPTAGWGGAFVLYASASLLWSPEKLWSGVLLVSLIAAFFLGSLIECHRRFWFWVLVGLTLNLLFGNAIFGNPEGLLGNPNYAGCALAMGIAGAIVYWYYWFVPIGIVGLVVSGSRGAILASGLTILAALWQWSRSIAAVTFVIAVVLVLSGDRSGSISDRLGVWQDTFNHLTIFGSGFGSFFESYMQFPVRTFSWGSRPPHAYNDYLELLFDLGIGTIPLFIFIAYLFESKGPGKLIILCFLILALTYFPLRVVGLLFAFTLGGLYSTLEKPNGSLETYRPALS